MARTDDIIRAFGEHENTAIACRRYLVVAGCWPTHQGGRGKSPEVTRPHVAVLLASVARSLLEGSTQGAVNKRDKLDLTRADMAVSTGRAFVLSDGWLTVTIPAEVVRAIGSLFGVVYDYAPEVGYAPTDRKWTQRLDELRSSPSAFNDALREQMRR
jgi:hypothetical protein